VRELPRFEVVQIAPGRYAGYDYLTRQARFAANPRSFTATEYVVASMASEARQKGEALSVLRAETPVVKKPRETKPKEGVRA
jgi:hypothetical protein